MRQKSVLFVCLGNICRSPMALTVFNKIINDNNSSDRYRADAAGLLDYHEGNPADQRTRKHAEDHGYQVTHLSRPIKQEDFEQFDYIVGMDESNINTLKRMTQNREQENKIYRMADFLQHMESDHIPDPYYGTSADFELVIELLEDAVDGFYNALESGEI